MFGTSLVVQWLRISLVIQGMWVQSLSDKLRSHLPWSNQDRPPAQITDPPCPNHNYRVQAQAKMIPHDMTNILYATIKTQCSQINKYFFLI